MPTCPECAQLVPADVARCPRCGHDLHARPLPPERRSDRDPEQDADELLAAVIATDAAPHPPAPWNEPRRVPMPAPARAAVVAPQDELRDVVPVVEKKPFWRRRR